MTTHTYAGYTAAQIRAAAEAAEVEAPCPWRTDQSPWAKGRIKNVAGWGIADTLTTEVTPHIATSCPSTVLALLDRIAELEADKRALRIDAERYRWIRDKERFHIDGECGDAEFSSSMCCAEEFDDALDDAMAQPAE